MERTITIRQGEYRDENIRVYVDEDGATITLFDRDSLKIEEEMPEARGGFRVKSINGDFKPRKFDLKIEAPMETKAVEKAVKKLEEFNPEFYKKTEKKQNKRHPAISLEEIKERILDYAKEKDNGEGFTFRYGAALKYAPEESKKEGQEIVKKVSGDKRKIKKGLSELIKEGKLERRLAKGKRNLFLYFLNNNGQATVKENILTPKNLKIEQKNNKFKEKFKKKLLANKTLKENIKNFEGEITDEYWTKDAESEEKLFPFKKNIEEEKPVEVCPKGEHDELVAANKCPRCGGKLLPVDLGSENIEAYACDTLSPTKSCLICGQEYYGKEEKKEEEPCII